MKFDMEISAPIVQGGPEVKLNKDGFNISQDVELGHISGNVTVNVNPLYAHQRVFNWINELQASVMGKTVRLNTGGNN